MAWAACILPKDELPQELQYQECQLWCQEDTALYIKPGNQTVFSMQLMLCEQNACFVAPISQY